MVGLNCYWKLGKDAKVTVPEIEQRWKEIQSDLLPFLQKVHKPLMFVEVGWFSQTNAANEPWDYTKRPADRSRSAKEAIRRFLQSWWGNPSLGGFLDLGLAAAGIQLEPAEDKGYTPEGKPALDVLKEWLKKGRWEVK